MLAPDCHKHPDYRQKPRLQDLLHRSLESSVTEVTLQSLSTYSCLTSQSIRKSDRRRVRTLMEPLGPHRQQSPVTRLRMGTVPNQSTRETGKPFAGISGNTALSSVAPGTE